MNAVKEAAHATCGVRLSEATPPAPLSAQLRRHKRQSARARELKPGLAMSFNAKTCVAFTYLSWLITPVPDCRAFTVAFRCKTDGAAQGMRVQPRTLAV